MTPQQRCVGGLWCGEVLERLSQFVDDDLPVELRSQIEEHLAGCGWCESFGGEFQALIAVFKASLTVPDSLPDEVAARLRERLERA